MCHLTFYIYVCAAWVVVTGHTTHTHTHSPHSTRLGLRQVRTHYYYNSYCDSNARSCTDTVHLHMRCNEFYTKHSRRLDLEPYIYFMYSYCVHAGLAVGRWVCCSGEQLLGTPSRTSQRRIRINSRTEYIWWAMGQREWTGHFFEKLKRKMPKDCSRTAWAVGYLYMYSVDALIQSSVIHFYCSYLCDVPFVLCSPLHGNRLRRKQLQCNCQPVCIVHVRRRR